MSEVDKIEKLDLNEETSKHRTKLPVPMGERNEMTIVSILKQCIGKDLSKITMPVFLNEPLSFLQRMVEYFEYTYLLRKANECSDPVERMEYVTAFIVSSMSSNQGRIGKPFNPVLGETFEMERPEFGVKIVCEQVSHHPPISALHAKGEEFELFGCIQPKMRFWGKSIEVTPKGTITLILPKHEEKYTWQSVNCEVNNIFVGKLWIEHTGTLEIINHSSKMKSVIQFKSSDLLNREVHKTEGFLYQTSGSPSSLMGSSHGKKLKAFQGSWPDCLYSYEVGVYENYLKNHKRSPSPFSFRKSSPDPSSPPSSSSQSSFDLQLDNQKLLWKSNERPINSNLYYNFTNFALSLNELTPDLLTSLPPTDSRFRSDIRSMEEGDIDKAGKEKNRIEEKQREALKERKKQKIDWTPRWFQSNKKDENTQWTFNGKYWNRDFQGCVDIF